MEGYGGWALRMEVVPIESAYPGFGELVVSYPPRFFPTLSRLVSVLALKMLTINFVP